MVLLVLETHRALHFSDRVDERPQRIARKRMVVAAGVDVLELPGLVVRLLRIDAFEDEAFDLVCGVERVAVLLELIVRVFLQDAADVGTERRAVAIEHFTEDEHLAGTEDVAGRMVERTPVDRESQIAFALRREAANRRPVEGQIVGRLDHELLVVVEHVQAAFEVAEHDGDGLDPLIVGQILDALFLQLVRRHAVLPLLLDGQIQFFELAVGEHEVVAQFGNHRFCVRSCDVPQPNRDGRTSAGVHLFCAPANNRLPANNRMGTPGGRWPKVERPGLRLGLRGDGPERGQSPAPCRTRAPRR